MTSTATDVPLYLTLLQPSSDAGLAVTDIRRCVQRSGPNLTTEIKEMLAQPNWRLHLVAAVALLVAGGTHEQLEILWSAIGRPSWVSPQLVASASSLDPGFAEQARVIIEHRCRFGPQPVADMDWGKLRQAPGTSFFKSPSTKTLSALVALCSLGGEPAWLEALKNTTDIHAILASDSERGGEIAVRWLAGITPFIGQEQSGS